MSMSASSDDRGQWGSKLGFIMAAAGSGFSETVLMLVAAFDAAVDALSGDLGTSGKEGTGSLARKDAVAKWRRSRHRFDAMDELSKRALRKYGYSVRERRRRKPS